MEGCDCDDMTTKGGDAWVEVEVEPRGAGAARVPSAAAAGGTVDGRIRLPPNNIHDIIMIYRWC
jgi:hypothetical protein